MPKTVHAFEKSICRKYGFRFFWINYIKTKVKTAEELAWIFLEDRLKIISSSFWKSRFSKISYGEFVLGMSKNVFFDFCYTSTPGVCFSEPARKMTQNGGRIVVNGPIFVIVFEFWSFRFRTVLWTIELLALADPNVHTIEDRLSWPHRFAGRWYWEEL